MAVGEKWDREASGRPAGKRIASADELDRYIKVTNPSAWAVIAAALLLVAGVVFWAIVAVVPVTVETTGVLLQDAATGKDVVYCWVDKATSKRIASTDLVAFVDGVQAKDATMRDMPQSASEVVKALGTDFYADSIDLDDWNYQVKIDPGEIPEHTSFTVETADGKAYLVPVTIVTSETHPINIVLGQKG
jgi:hypothetical protein